MSGQPKTTWMILVILVRRGRADLGRSQLLSPVRWITGVDSWYLRSDSYHNVLLKSPLLHGKKVIYKHAFHKLYHIIAILWHACCHTLLWNFLQLSCFHRSPNMTLYDFHVFCMLVNTGILLGSYGKNKAHCKMLFLFLEYIGNTYQMCIHYFFITSTSKWLSR